MENIVSIVTQINLLTQQLSDLAKIIEDSKTNIANIHYSTNLCKQYEWTVKNLALRSFNFQSSPEFTMGKYSFDDGQEEGKLKWIIKLVLEKNQPIEIYLILKDFQALKENSISIKCAFQVFCGNAQENIANINSILEFEFNKSSLTAGPLEGITIKQEDLNNNDLKIAVSLIEQNSENKFIETTHKKLSFSVPNPELEIANDFKNLLFNEDASDFILKSKTQKYKVHKAILIARSPYFAAALKNDMKEKQENKMDITEEDNIIKQLLNYIYTGQVQNTEELAKDLFIAADKYQLDGLKKICIYELFKTVNIQNAIDWFSFANQYNSEEFENYLIKFIIFNQYEIQKTDGFKLLAKNYPKLSQFLNCHFSN